MINNFQRNIIIIIMALIIEGIFIAYFPLIAAFIFNDLLIIYFVIVISQSNEKHNKDNFENISRMGTTLTLQGIESLLKKYPVHLKEEIKEVINELEK